MKKNKILWISSCISPLYIGLALYFLISLMTQNDDGWGAVFGAVFSIFLIPSIILVSIGLIFGWLAYVKNKRWFTLTSLILYLFGAMIALQFGLFLIPNIILNLIAFIQQVSQFKKDKEAALGLIP